MNFVFSNKIETKILGTVLRYSLYPKSDFKGLHVPCVTMAMQDNNTVVKLSYVSAIRNAGFAILGE